MKAYVFFLATTMILLWNAAVQADDVLVVAHPKKVEFVMPEGDLPENQNTGNIYVGGVYKTPSHPDHSVPGTSVTDEHR